MDLHPMYKVDFAQDIVHSEDGMIPINQYLNQVTPHKHSSVKSAYESFGLDISEKKLEAVKKSLFEVTEPDEQYVPITEPISDDEIVNNLDEIEQPNEQVFEKKHIAAKLLGVTDKPKRRIRQKNIKCSVRGCTKNWHTNET